MVTMEIIKYFQGMFISWDADIYDKKNKGKAIVQTSTLNEELGQVKVSLFNFTIISIYLVIRLELLHE